MPPLSAHLCEPHTIASLREQFRSNPPFPHVVFDGLLEPAFCQALQREFPAYDAASARNELGRTGGKAVFPEVNELGPAYRRFDQLIQSPEFLEWLGRVTGFEGLEYDPAYVGGGAHLNLNGQDLDLHVDFNYHPTTRHHRRLNLILFLNEHWEQTWGGCLELHRNPKRPEENQVARVTPAANRCVIFETSERSWHGFERIAMPEEQAQLGRRSLAVYFYTRDRPAEETASPHGTFYVPRPLPDRFIAGHTLDERDVHDLQLLLARRDQQIEHLYQREMELWRALESPAVRLAQKLAAPARRVRRWLRGKNAR